MDKGNIPINIYLDMSKAFDILDHRIMEFWPTDMSMKKEQKLQKKSLRIVTPSDYRANTEPLFKKLKV